MERARRKEQADRAYELQVKSGSLGALKATLYGLTLAMSLGKDSACDIVFDRRQTLAIKGFLVSSCTIFGLVVGADTALLSHEAEHRLVEDRLRRDARIELARQGKVATEPEIVRWIARKEELAREKEEEQIKKT